jgi:serine/threonine protein kinase
MRGLEQSELGSCRLIRRIGAGAMGEVYLAEQLRLGNRLVAVKVVRAEQDISSPDVAAEDAERHFIREAKLLGQLTHPNILPVYHSGVEAGYRFLVMQYAPDGSLADAINGKGQHRLDLPASLPFSVDIIGQVADALQYTHEHRVIHADVKPANVLAQIGPNGHWHVLLADFGIAQSRDTVATHDEVAGTVAYMAPEQFYGQVSPASDQYALGVMAYQLLAGRTPFVGSFIQLAQAHAREQPPAIRDFNPAVPAAIEAVIMRALAKQPADRHPSVAAFAESLRSAVMGASTIFDASTRGVAEVTPGRAEARPSSATSHFPVLVGAWNEPAPAHSTPPPTVLFAHPAATNVPNTTQNPREQGGSRRTAVGLAVIALLLVAVIAAIGLRSHIDVSRASSSHGTGASTGQTSGASGAPGAPSASGGSGAPSGQGAGAGATSSPTSISKAPGTPTPGPAPSPTPPATVTPAGTPTATAAPPPAQPTATPAPSPTATAGPPAATATPPPTQPTATPAPPTQPPSTPASSQPSTSSPVPAGPASTASSGAGASVSPGSAQQPAQPAQPGLGTGGSSVSAPAAP